MPYPVQPTPDSQITSLTGEYWTIDDGNGEVALASYGWNVTTKGGSQYDLPTKRGSNTRIPYKPGSMYNAGKLADERTVVLSMWINSADPSGANTFPDPTLQWNDSWNFMHELVWQPNGAQLVLTRRWWRTVNGTPTLLKASALAEVVDNMPPTMTGPYRATFTMTLLLSNPFFMGDWITEDIGIGQTKTIYNPGQDYAMYTDFIVEFHGPLSTPVLTNHTPTPNVWLKYNSGLMSGMVTCDVENWTAVRAVDNVNVIRYIDFSGSQYFFGLLPKNNAISLEAPNSGPGFVRLKYKPSYL